MSWLKKIVKRASRSEQTSSGKKGPDRDRGKKPHARTENHDDKAVHRGRKPDRHPGQDRMKKEHMAKADAGAAPDGLESIETTLRKREESYRQKRLELEILIKRGEDGDAPARKLKELEQRWAEESKALKGKIRELKGGV